MTDQLGRLHCAARLRSGADSNATTRRRALTADPDATCRSAAHTDSHAAAGRYAKPDEDAEAQQAAEAARSAGPADADSDAATAAGITPGTGAAELT